jgi:hypothetical protein
VVLRVLARTFTDLAKSRGSEELFPAQTGATVEQLLSEIADAVVSFAVLVTTHLSENAESAEARLTAELHTAAGTRDRLAELFQDEIRKDWADWQLLGAVLTETTRMLDELNTEHRTRRLLEELDRVSREQRTKLPRMTRLRERLGVQEELWRNRAGFGERSP